MRGARRITRAQALGGAAAAAAAAALAARELGGGGAAPGLRMSGHRYEPDLGSGWGREWTALTYGRLLARGGDAVFSVPRGLRGAAPDQPMPVLLTDRECADCEQLATFAVTDATLRPGVLLRRTGPYEFVGVTAERGRLVAAAYGRERRHVLAVAPAKGIAPNAAAHLRVRVTGTGLAATLWRRGSAEPRPQLHTSIPAGKGGAGILLVQPTSLRAGELRVDGYALGSDERFEPTPPLAIATITGVPEMPAHGPGRTIARVWSALPARATIEWSEDPGFAAPQRGPTADLTEPPHTHAQVLPLAAGRPVWWRARLESPTSGAAVRTRPHRVEPYAGGPLVLLGASCAQYTGASGNAGFARLLDACPAPPAALVYQGDIGYANNARDACYAAEPGYFADRWGRTLAEKRFAGFRRSVPVGFTMDDHDYGPPNNADRTTVEPWTWHAWNRIHADPTPVGYFDFRAGDVHCLTLDGRRYCDPVTSPNTPTKTKLGRTQFDWMARILETSDAAMFVVFSADIFATRSDPRNGKLVDDCFIYGWPDEYRRAMSLFMDVQLGGRRVLVVSGDAHGLRLHYHPDPRGRPAAARLSIVELVCAGLRARLWSAAGPHDKSLDPGRYVLHRSGAGMLVIDPPGSPRRGVTVRAIDVDAALGTDAFPPLRIGFAPGDDRKAAGMAPRAG